MQDQGERERMRERRVIQQQPAPQAGGRACIDPVPTAERLPPDLAPERALAHPPAASARPTVDQRLVPQVPHLADRDETRKTTQHPR
jgi:hypothetical protein